MNVTKDAFKRQSAKRQKARLSARHWKEWTKEHIEIKEETKRDRKEVWEKLADMGLGGVDEGGAALIRGDSIGMEGGERMEERDLDMGLHEVSYSKYFAVWVLADMSLTGRKAPRRVLFTFFLPSYYRSTNESAHQLAIP